MKTEDDSVDSALNLLRIPNDSAASYNADLEKRLMQEFRYQLSKRPGRHRTLLVAVALLTVGGAAFAATDGVTRLRQWLFTVEIGDEQARILVPENGEGSIVIEDDDGASTVIHVRQDSLADGADKVRVQVNRSDPAAGTATEDVRAIVRGGTDPESKPLSLDVIEGIEPISTWIDEQGTLFELYMILDENGDSARFVLLTEAPDHEAEIREIGRMRHVGAFLERGVLPDVSVNEEGVLEVVFDDGAGLVQSLKLVTRDDTTPDGAIRMNVSGGEVRVRVEEPAPPR